MTLYMNSWMSTLPAMLVGMLGIFLVIGTVVLSVYLLGMLDKPKEEQ